MGCGSSLTGCGRHTGPRLPCPPHGEHAPIGVRQYRARPFFASAAPAPLPRSLFDQHEDLVGDRVEQAAHRAGDVPQASQHSIEEFGRAGHYDHDQPPGHRHRREGQAQYQPGLLRRFGMTARTTGGRRESSASVCSIRSRIAVGDSSSIRATTWSWPAPSAAPLPFLTGIGHEREPTILDVASEASLCAQPTTLRCAPIRTARSWSSATGRAGGRHAVR